MKRFTVWILGGMIGCCLSAGFSQTVNITVNVNSSLLPISPYIYGANPEFTADENLAARRLGGNRMTGYNWENNASHAGTDWYNDNDTYMTIGLPNPDDPAATLTAFHDEAFAVGAYSLITLQMAGYVARDKSGTSVTQEETAPSSRFNRVQFAKGSAFSLQPNGTDTLVYMDECVNFLVNRYGLAKTTTGVKGYELDNEPALWPSTHPRIHPASPTCAEVTQHGIALSKAVKDVDSTADIFGPVLFGFSAYYDFQGASDWSSVSSGENYSWFIDYYLDQMKSAEKTYGRRLFNVLDIHWYPEAYGDNRIVDTGANTANDKAERMQAPRTLWDKNYGYSSTDPTKGENSWISQWYSSALPLIPHLMNSIKTYYPGTKLAFTEFTYGGERDITGAIATADVLGIFGKYGVYFATFWPVNDNTSFVQAAYRIYRNYDGTKSTFGDVSTLSRTSDSVNTSVYSSVKTGTNEVHLILINKKLTSSVSTTIAVNDNHTLLGGNAWVLTSGSTQIQNAGGIASIQNNSFTYTMPAASVSHLVLQRSATVGIADLYQTLPLEFKVQAYPNPFNPSTNITYQIPVSSYVRLTVYDVLGREVADLVHEFQKAGTYTKLFHAQGLASGTYFYRLTAGTYQQTKKVVLLR